MYFRCPNGINACAEMYWCNEFTLVVQHQAYVVTSDVIHDM